MKYVPRRSQVIGRVVIKRMLSVIVRPDETRDTTKFVLIDAVGADAEAAGIRVGDVVMPGKLNGIKLDGGISIRMILEEKDILCWVTGIPLEEFAVQTENGTKYVPFDADDAAKPLCDIGEREWVASRKASAESAEARA